MPSDSATSVHTRDGILLRLLRTPWRILGLMLVVVFAVEAVVMLLLPQVLPAGLSEAATAVIDAALLTAISAPLLWWIIISPLRRIALEAQRLSSTIVENAGDGIVTVDAAGKLLSYNPAAQQLFGYDAAQILGRPVADLLPDVSLTSTSVGEVVSTSGRRKDGSVFPASVSIRRLGDEDQSAVVIVIRDLTTAIQAEEERTAAVREQEALRAQQMATLAQLATGVAHEIRNPLTAIKMLVQSSTAEEDKSTFSQEDLKIVEDQIRRMEQSVNALLDFARPTAAEYRPVTIREIVPDVVRLLEGQAGKQAVRLQVAEGVSNLRLNADRDQLQQLLLNLGLNALNAMARGGTLSFSVRFDEPERVCILVSDTGPGIADEILEDIFKPFYTTRKQGIGLGLNICRRIAEEHGGTLTARNHPEGGAVFELCLPSVEESV